MVSVRFNNIFYCKSFLVCIRMVSRVNRLHMNFAEVQHQLSSQSLHCIDIPGVITLTLYVNFTYVTYAL